MKRCGVVRMLVYLMHYCNNGVQNVDWLVCCVPV